jgi:hypothetical protein
MGWRLVEVERVDADTRVKSDFTIPTPNHVQKEESGDFPDRYTEEDRKATLVLEGCCKACFHLWFVNTDTDSRIFKGFWCKIFKKKLGNKIENCQSFLSNSEGLDELITRMDANGELPEWIGE